jgi:hypothetical protein
VVRSDKKLIRDQGASPAAFAKPMRPVLPKRYGLPICGPVDGVADGLTHLDNSKK